MKTNFFYQIIILFALISLSRYGWSQTYNAIDWGITVDDDYNNSTGWTSNEQMEQVIVDNTVSPEEIYVVGRTYSTPSGKTLKCGITVVATLGYGDVFVAKYATTVLGCGTLKWLTYFGSSGGGVDFDYGYCMALDHDGNGAPILYVAGATNNNPLNNVCPLPSPCTGTRYQNTKQDNKEAFIARFDGNSGSLINWTFFGGTKPGADARDEINGITVYDHNIYFCGYTESTTGLVNGSPIKTTNNAYSAGGDGFFAEMNDCLTTLKLFEFYRTDDNNSVNFPTLQDRCKGIKVYPSGTDIYIVVSGTAESTKGIATTGAWDTNNGGGNPRDAFIGKWKVANGLTLSPVWSTYLGGSKDEHARQLDLDNSNNIYVTGWSKSTSGFPASTCWINSTNAGGFDSYIGRVSATSTTGSPDWLTLFGGSSDEFSCGIKWFSASGNEYVMIAGYTLSTNLPTTVPILSQLNGGNNTTKYDAFVTVLTNPANCTGSQTQSFSTYLGGTDDENTVTIGYGPYIDFGNNQELYLALTIMSSDMVSTIGAGYQHVITDFHGSNGSNSDAFLCKLINTSNLSQVNCTVFPNRLSNQNNSGSYMKIDISPDPFANLVQLHFSSLTDGQLAIEVFNLYGQKIIDYSFNFKSGENTIPLDLMKQPSGVYLVQIDVDGRKFQQKLLKE